MKVKNALLAGRITLAKSVVSSLLIYQMQTTLLLSPVLMEMDTLVRKCIWGSFSCQRKAHLVSWDKICISKKEGGLGVKRSAEMNKAMLARLGWRMMNADQALWSRTLLTKYRGG